MLAGCSALEKGAGDAGPSQCAKGLKPTGSACVPIFDECAGDEVPLLGGGCLRVGVKECLGGWGLAGPPDWKCQPIGPPLKCLQGWAKVKGGWCEPILPNGPCPAGTMEKIGYTTCQPIGDCGTGTWGKIKATANTIYVDRSFAGGTSDGSQAKPCTTITTALAVAKAGDHIAVAAGKYKENVSISKKVTLEGRCAQQVTIAGTGTYQAVDMTQGASGTVLRGVTITGDGVGLWVNGADITVERAAVRGCEGDGIDVDSGGELTLRHSLVAGNRTAGILVDSSKATVEHSVVRDTREQASDKQLGMGIQASVGSGQSKGSELVLRDSVVVDNRTAGILVGSSKATVERCVVRGTRERASDNQFGTGIYASVQSGQSRGSELVLRDSLLAGNQSAGIIMFSSKATVERTVIRDTRERASNKLGGRGILAAIQPGQSKGAELELRDSLLTGNRARGIGLFSSKATVERSVVRDTRVQASDKQFGIGIEATVLSGLSQGSGLVMRDSLVAGNRSAGIVVSSSKATVERSVVRDTLKVGTGIYGDGLTATNKSTLDVRDTTVGRSTRAGILFVNAGGSVHRCLIRQNVFAIDLEQGANPTIGTDNLLTENKVNKVTTGQGLKAAPAPAVPNPTGKP